MIHCRTFVFLIAMLGALRAFATSLPLVENFEQTSGDFIASSSASWKWGVPVAGPTAAHSGTQAWGTNLTSASYSSGEDAVLTSPEYDLSGYAGKAIVVHWWQWLVSEAGFDEARVEVSRDSGGTWETVFGPRSGVVDAAWTQHTVLLDPSYATAHFQIRFRLTSDDFPSQGGFFIDDLRLSAAALTEAAPLQDFELGNGGYVASGANSTWAYGTPVSAPGAAYSGTGAWATNLNGFYNANEDSVLTSPAFDLTGSAGKLLILSWRQFFETEEGFDFGTVEISNDNGVTWALAPADETLSGPVSATGWMRRQCFVDASYATAGFRIRFRLNADDTYQFDGWAIDDVAIFAASGLFPSTGAFSKAAPQNNPIVFSKADFTSHFSDPDGGELAEIMIVQLPASGTLKLGAATVTVGQSIPVNGLGTLSYVPVTDSSGVESFRWSARNFFGSSAAGTVSLAILTPTPRVVITSAPLSQVVNPGAPVTLSVTAVSSLPLTFQWRRNLTPIANATGATYTIPAAAEIDEDSYDVIVSNATESVTSSAAIVSVNDPVSVIAQPLSTFVNEGDSITLAVHATGTGRLDYQWWKDSAPIPDATFATLKIAEAKAADQASYRCVVTNIVGPVSTDAAIVTIRLQPRILVHPISRGVVVNGKVKYKVEVEGFGPFTYQWLKDGIEIPGATGAVLVLDHLLSTNAGSYSVRVGNGIATVESDPATLQVFVWDAVKGNYQDVLERQEPLGADETPFPGRLTVAITRGGRFTGTLEYLGRKHRFRGGFNSELAAQKIIPQANQPSLTLDLQLDAETLTLGASVTQEVGGVSIRSEGLLPRHRYIRQVNPAPEAGRYTVLLQPAEDLAVPAAPGFLVAKVNSAGHLRVSGKLPDGRNIACGAYVHSTSRVAIYQRLYLSDLTSAGELSGRLALPATPLDPLVDGGLVWRKPRQKSAAILTGPFLADIGVIGSRYRAPVLNQAVIVLPEGKDLLDLRITDLIPATELQRWVHLTPGNVFLADPKSGERIGFSVARRNGLLHGTYTDPLMKKRYRLLGVALQAQGMFGGMVLQEVPGTFTMVPFVE